MSGARWFGKLLPAVLLLGFAHWATSSKLVPGDPFTFWALVVACLAAGEAAWFLFERRAGEDAAHLHRRGLDRIPGQAATPRVSDWFLTGARPRMADILAGQDAPREYAGGLQTSLAAPEPLPRLHLLQAAPGQGRSTLLLRLGHILARHGYQVWRALPGPRLTDLELVLHHAGGRPVFLLLDDLPATPQATELLYEVLKSHRSVVVIATADLPDPAADEENLLSGLAPADLTSLAVVHAVPTTPNDVGALVPKLGASQHLGRTQVSGEAAVSYLAALDYLRESRLADLWDRPEIAKLPTLPKLMLALAGAAEMGLPPALLTELAAPDKPAVWVKAGLVAEEGQLALPPHRQVCLALLTGAPEQAPLVAQALGTLLTRLLATAPALAPRLLCGLGRVPALRSLAAAAARERRPLLELPQLPGDLRRLWQHTFASLDQDPRVPGVSDDSPPLLAATAHYLLRQGEHAAALELYRSLTQDPVYRDLARFNAALVLAHGDQFKQAEDELAGLRTHVPGSHYLRGVIAEKRGTLMAALDDYDTSRQLGEITLPATRRLAFTYLRSGAPRAAIPLFESALAATPLRADLYGGLAVAHLHAGATQRAVAQSARAIQAGVDPGVARKAVARAFRDSNAFDRQASELEAAVAYDPQDQEAWDALATACHTLGRFEREEQCLLALQRGDGGDAAGITLRLAGCLRNQGRAAEAWVLLEPLVAAATPPLAALLLGAEVVGAMGQPARQHALAAAALQQGDTSGWAHFWWADSQDAAVADVADGYRRARQLLADRLERGLPPRQAATLWQAIFVACERLGDTEGAEQALRQARQEATVCRAIGSEVESVTARRSVPADVFIDGFAGFVPSGAAEGPGVTETPRPSGSLHDVSRPSSLPGRSSGRGGLRG